MWRNFLIPEVDLTTQSRLMKEHLGTVPGECLHTYSALKEKGVRGGVLGGPTEHFIQVAMHVREMKAGKQLPVIVPIKEQLRLGSVVNMAAVLGLPAPLNIQVCKQQECAFQTFSL